MATIKKYQNNFTTGAISPGVYARIDLQKYASGCKRIVNGIVHAHGGISNRPGTQYLDTLPGTGMLFPFTYNVTQAYVLAFYADPSNTDGLTETGAATYAHLRIYKNGAAVINSETGQLAVILTPYLPSELSKLKFAQSADVMFIAHPAHPPMKLTRSTHYTWTFEPLAFRPNLNPPATLTATPSGFTDSTGTYVVTTIYYKVSAVDAKGNESIPTAAVSASALSTWPTGARVALSWAKVSGADHYEVYKNSRGYYAWIGSAEAQNFTDDNIEGSTSTGPKNSSDPFNLPAAPTIAFVQSSPHAGTGGHTWRIVATVISNAGLESLSSNELSFTQDSHYTESFNVSVTAVPSNASAFRLYFSVDAGSSWRYIEQLPNANGNSVLVEYASWNTYTAGVPQASSGCYPGAVGIIQQRLVFGRTNLEPQTVWMSETGAFDSMAVANPMRADSAITVTVDSRQMNEIRHFVPLKDLLMFTSGAEFLVSPGKNADAITPTSVAFNLQSYWGASDVPPIVSGNCIVFAENSGKIIRDLQYKLENDGYSGDEVSILAEHLLTSPVADWAYQQSPWGTIWICLASGKLLTFTYMREQEIWAWSEHESSGGKFRSVCCIRETEADHVYFLTERAGRYFIEFQRSRTYGDAVADAFYVDCGLSRGVDETETTAITSVTGLAHLAGQSVVALADGNVVRGLTVSSTGTVTLPAPATKIIVGLPYELLVETLDPEVKAQDGDTVGLKKNVARVTFQLRETRGLYAGPSEDALVPVKFPAPAQWGGAPALFSGLVNLTIPGSHRDEATVVFVQRDPLPVTVLGIQEEIGVG